jgi:hypothetical protein
VFRNDPDQKGTRHAMSTGVRVAITAGVVLLLAAVWWAFEPARPASRRSRLDRRAASYGQRQVARGWRRPSFVLFAITQLLLLLVLIWVAVVR